MLLGAVVEVALEAASFGVLGLDETLARGLDLLGPDQQLRATVVELGSEPDPLQHQARLGGQPGEQPFLDERERQAGALLQPEHPQQLAAVAHRQGSQALAVTTISSGRRDGGVRSASTSAGQVAARVRRPETVSHTCAHCRPGSLGKQHRHPRRQLVGRVRTGDRVRELAQHVVRRRGAQTPPGRGPFERGLHACEQQRHDGGRQHRQRHAGGVGAADECPTTEHDDHVDADHEPRQAEQDDQPAPAATVQLSEHAAWPHSAVCASSACPGEGLRRTQGWGQP